VIPGDLRGSFWFLQLSVTGRSRLACCYKICRAIGVRAAFATCISAHDLSLFVQFGERLSPRSAIFSRQQEVAVIEIGERIETMSEALPDGRRRRRGSTVARWSDQATGICVQRPPRGHGLVFRESKARGPQRWADTADELTATIPTVILIFSRGDDGCGPRRARQVPANHKRKPSVFVFEQQPAAFRRGVTCLL
jgi:hypothetical protein